MTDKAPPGLANLFMAYAQQQATSSVGAPPIDLPVQAEDEWVEVRGTLDLECWFRRGAIEGIPREQIIEKIHAAMAGNQNYWLPLVSYNIRELHQVGARIEQRQAETAYVPDERPGQRLSQPGALQGGSAVIDWEAAARLAAETLAADVAGRASEQHGFDREPGSSWGPTDHKDERRRASDDAEPEPDDGIRLLATQLRNAVESRPEAADADGRGLSGVHRGDGAAVPGGPEHGDDGAGQQLRKGWGAHLRRRADDVPVRERPPGDGQPDRVSPDGARPGKRPKRAVDAGSDHRGQARETVSVAPHDNSRRNAP